MVPASAAGVGILLGESFVGRVPHGGGVARRGQQGAPQPRAAAAARLRHGRVRRGQASAEAEAAAVQVMLRVGGVRQ